MTHKHEGSSVIAGLIDMEHSTTALVINGVPDLETGKEGLLAQEIPAILTCITGQPVKFSLVIGFGMGLTAATLEASQAPHMIISEIYPEVLSLSAEVFAEENNDILTSSFVDISNEDARLFLLRDSSRFDLVTSGYTHLRLAPGLYTREFYQTCSGRLSRHGLLTQVLPLEGIDLPEFRSLVKSCTSIFPMVSLWYLTRDRVLLLARNDNSAPGFCDFAGQFQKVVNLRIRGTLGIPDPESLLGRQLMDNQQLRAFVEGAPENTNDRPFVEFSKTVPGFRDRMLIEELVRRMRPACVPADASGCRHDTAEISLRIDQVQQAIRKDLLQVPPGHK